MKSAITERLDGIISEARQLDQELAEHAEPKQWRLAELTYQAIDVEQMRPIDFTREMGWSTYNRPSNEKRRGGMEAPRKVYVLRKLWRLFGEKHSDGALGLSYVDAYVLAERPERDVESILAVAEIKGISPSRASIDYADEIREHRDRALDAERQETMAKWEERRKAARDGTPRGREDLPLGAGLLGFMRVTSALSEAEESLKESYADLAGVELSDEEREIISMHLDSILTAHGVLAEWLKSGGISDAELKALLDGDEPA